MKKNNLTEEQMMDKIEKRSDVLICVSMISMIITLTCAIFCYYNSNVFLGIVGVVHGFVFACSLSASNHCENTIRNHLIFNTINDDEEDESDRFSDYERWKQWFDEWGIEYVEQSFTDTTKTLTVHGSTAGAGVTFDSQNNDKFIEFDCSE